MSSGHHAASTLSSRDVNDILAKPGVKANLLRPVTLNNAYDLPYLAGYSKDGKTIYFDRHLPRHIRVGNQAIDPETFIQVHERTEKALIDALQYKYIPAHDVATAVERRFVLKSGLNWQQYSKALAPYIKADEHETIVSCPKDLDLTPYLDNKELLVHIKAHQHESVGSA